MSSIVIKENQTIFKLKAAASHKIWGGSKLSKLKSIALEGKLPVGETWEVSVHSDGLAQTETGPLSDLVNSKELPYLVKFIDTSDVLSIQVHPDENYAQLNENSRGKTECWLILDAGEDGGIYLGFKENVNKDEFEAALKSGAKIDDYLQFYPVKRGDFFYVPAGAVHAIGANVFLAEVQQSSNITYRVWDWNRLDNKGNTRELHVDKAMEVLNFDPKFNSEETFKVSRNIFSNENGHTVITHEDFNVNLLKDGGVLNAKGKRNSFLNLEKEMLLKRGDEVVTLAPYEAAYILESNESIEISGEGSLIHIN